MLIILDSYAVLAYLEGEAGAGRVGEILHLAGHGQQRLALSLINLGEVLYIIEREKGLFTAQEVLATIQQLPIQVLEADQRQVLAAAHIKANYPVSYADAFAIAAAQTFAGTLLTGDPEFHAVERLVQVEWLPG